MASVPNITAPSSTKGKLKVLVWVLVVALAIPLLALIIGFVFGESTPTTTTTPSSPSQSTATAAAPTPSRCLVPARVYTLSPGQALRPPQSDCAWGANFLPAQDIQFVSIVGSGGRLVSITPNTNKTVQVEVVFCPAGRRRPNSLECF